MRGRRPRRVIFAAVAVGALLVVSGPALAGHSVRFEQQQVAADTEVTLELLVPEAGEDHNPEGTQDHHTTQVKVTVPAAFQPVGCVPPDGWDCVRTGELFRFFRERDLALVRDETHTFGVYVRTPGTNGTWGFRTEQVYNDGHETRFTVEGGTAPSVTVTGATPSSPSPAPSRSPTATESPAPAPQPSPASTPTASPSPSSPAPTASAAEPRDDATATTDDDPASTTDDDPASTTDDDPASTTDDDPASTSDTDGTSGPDDQTAPSPVPDPTDDGPSDAEPLAGSQTGDAVPGGLGDLDRAALSLVVVSGGWTIVEHRARRRTGGA